MLEENSAAAFGPFQSTSYPISFQVGLQGRVVDVRPRRHQMTTVMKIAWTQDLIGRICCVARLSQEWKTMKDSGEGRDRQDDGRRRERTAAAP
jgi:hypothetical protein